MLDEVYSHSDSPPDRETTSVPCSSGSYSLERRICDNLIFGSFVSELIHLKFLPTKKTSSDIISSVTDLQLQLKCIKFLFQPGHERYSFVNGLFGRLGSIVSGTELDSTEDEERHLELRRSRFPVCEDDVPEHLLT